MPTPEKHALLSASSSARWMRCTRAPRLEETLPETTSSYAEEGRIAHAVAELKAAKKFTVMNTRTYNARMKKLEAEPGYQKEMQGYADLYVEHLTEEAMRYATPPVVALESRVDFSAWVPEGFGTADCVMIGGDCITVIDYKYGQGVTVSAEQNSQMMLYALGALATQAVFFGDMIQRVRMLIIQPRINNISVWECTRSELEAWAETNVKHKAALAFAGEGDFAPGEDTCRFCRAKSMCRARAAAYLGLEAYIGATPEGTQLETELPDAPRLLSDEEVGDLLLRFEPAIAWLKDLKEYALTATLAGREIPGWKAVEGRSLRAFADLDTAINTLAANGYPQDVIYDRVPKTLSQIEKLLGKKTFEEMLGNQVVKPAGKPTLVPISDKRPAYNAALAAFGN